MTPYKNCRGNSPVIDFEYDDRSIRVMFKSRMTYEYLRSQIGESNFQTMKQLAEEGSGLSAFITKNVYEMYARRWKE